jgi:hypothetical protein
MNIYQALKCLADETASQEQVEEARAAVRKFLDDHAEDLATDPDRPATDAYPLAISLLAEHGICVMPFCHAADPREALTQQSFGDLGRKLPNAKPIQKVFHVVRAKGGNLPSAFERWRVGIISEAAKSLAQDEVNAWREPPGSRIRIIEKSKQGHSHEPDDGGADTDS